MEAHSPPPAPPIPLLPTATSTPMVGSAAPCTMDRMQHDSVSRLSDDSGDESTVVQPTGELTAFFFLLFLFFFPFDFLLFFFLSFLVCLIFVLLFFFFFFILFCCCLFGPFVLLFFSFCLFLCFYYGWGEFVMGLFYNHLKFQ